MAPRPASYNITGGLPSPAPSSYPYVEGYSLLELITVCNYTLQQLGKSIGTRGPEKASEGLLGPWAWHVYGAP